MAARPGTLLRYTHIILGIALATYVYLPLHLEAARDVLRLGLAVFGIPLVSATGIWMWKGHILRRRFQGRVPDRAA